MTGSLQVVGRTDVSIVRKVDSSTGGDIAPVLDRSKFPIRILTAAVFNNDRERAMGAARQFRLGTDGHHGPRTDFSIGFEPRVAG
ncbi:protein of unknown function (plasmid) [Caballeronia sp. S22]